MIVMTECFRLLPLLHFFLQDQGDDLSRTGISSKNITRTFFSEISCWYNESEAGEKQPRSHEENARKNASDPTSGPGRLLYVDTFEMPLSCGSTKSTMPVKAKASGPTPPHLPTCPALTRHGLGWVTRTGGTRSRTAADGWQAGGGRASRSGRMATGTASAAPAGRCRPLPPCICPASRSPPAHRAAHPDPPAAAQGAGWYTDAARPHAAIHARAHPPRALARCCVSCAVAGRTQEW